MNITLHHSTRKAVLKAMKSAQIQGNLKYFQRLQALLLLDKRLPLDQVAQVVLKSVRTLYLWVALLVTKGLQGLKPKTSPGRRSRLTPAQKHQLAALICQGPLACGFESGRWTAAMVQTLIFREFHAEYHVKYIPQLLDSLNLSYKRVEAVSHKADASARQHWKDTTFPDLIRQAQAEGAALLFEDESTFRMWSRTGYSWGERGKPLYQPVFMNNVYQKVFGAVDLASGRVWYRRAPSLKAVEFVKFMRHLLSRYAHKVYLVVDGGSSHKGPDVRAFLEAHAERIALVFLPSYSPCLNPIEKLWKQIKQERMHNRFFATEQVFQTELTKALRHFQRQTQQILDMMTKWSQRAQQALSTQT